MGPCTLCINEHIVSIYVVNTTPVSIALCVITSFQARLYTVRFAVFRLSTKDCVVQKCGEAACQRPMFAHNSIVAFVAHHSAKIASFFPVLSPNLPPSLPHPLVFTLLPLFTVHSSFLLPSIPSPHVTPLPPSLFLSDRSDGL